ncbi:MAG TPA: transglycosylase domain-containing protein, partial [Kineosporiaceae bacterium]
DYPRWGRTGVLRWLPSWKLFTGTALTLVVALIVGLLVGYAMTPVPPVQEVTHAQTTTVLYAGGKGVITKFAVDEGNRTIVDLGKLPAYVPESVIAAEDRTFYQNKGISPLGILRAAWNDLLGKPLQGGSTITQQYVKNTRITNEQTVTRKLKEFFIAIKIANSTDKRTVLQDYLNTIFFGRNAYGIQAAAKAYFGKYATYDPNHPTATITLPEAAYLAAIIDGPNQYDDKPTDTPAITKERRDLLKIRYDQVLDGMVALNYITQADRVGKYAGMPTPQPRQTQRATSSTLDDQTPYLTALVRSELNTLGFSQQDIDTGGFNIYTTIDKDQTGQAVKSIKDTLGPRTKKDGTPNWPDGTQVGLVSLDPKTGAVRAVYGGDGKTRSRSAASEDLVPAGSTFKLFSLLAALEGKSMTGEDGIALSSRFDGHSPYLYKKADKQGTKVFNFDNEFGKSHPLLDLKTALAGSVNTVFAQLNEEVTPKHTQDVAWRAGIPKSYPEESSVVGAELSNTLGNAAVTVLDLASAYGTVAANGYRAKPYVIDRIVRADGTVVYRHKDAPDKAFTEQVCADAIAALRQVVGPGGTGSYAGDHMDRPVAGKTGTVGVTTSRRTKSAWFVGFTPQVVTAVAMYRIDRKTGGQDDVMGWGKYENQNMQGGYFPVRVWTEYMQNVLKGQPVQDFPAEAGVGVPNEAAQLFQQQQTPASPTNGAPTGAMVSPTDPNATTTDPNNPIRSVTGIPNNPAVAGPQGNPQGNPQGDPQGNPQGDTQGNGQGRIGTPLTGTPGQ